MTKGQDTRLTEPVLRYKSDSGTLPVCNILVFTVHSQRELVICLLQSHSSSTGITVYETRFNIFAVVRPTDVLVHARIT